MSRISLAAFVTLCFAFIALPISAEGPAATAPASQPANTIRVKTADEFVKAIGSDRVIELEEGDYALTDVQDRKMKNVVWVDEFDGKSLIIRGVKNLKIIGVGKKPSHLVVQPRYVYVLGLRDCDGVTFENLKLGHAPDKGECSCGVMGIESSKNITIRSCDLYGSGTEGLELKKSENITFDQSSIHDCTYGILTADECKNLTFTKAHLYDNEEFNGLHFTDSESIAFTDCVIENNHASEPLIAATSSSDIVLKGCTIKKNTATSLTTPKSKAITLEKCTEEGNIYKPAE